MQQWHEGKLLILTATMMGCSTSQFPVSRGYPFNGPALHNTHFPGLTYAFGFCLLELDLVKGAHAPQ